MDSYEALEQSLKNYFTDTTRTPEQTKSGLEMIRDEIEIMLDSIE